jgi:4-amino-4-deoxy-L-arabinose transferase-like glycosyltransferase
MSTPPSSTHGQPAAEEAGTPRARVDWAGFAAVCAFALLLRVPVANMPLERDEGEYAYIAQQWLQGALPYRDSFDQKPPGVHIVYVLIESLGGTTPAAIHWTAQLYSLGTLAVVFVLGRRLASPAAGVAAAAFTAFMTIDPSVLGSAANTETFMLLPLTAALLASCYAVERASLGWAFAAGALGGAAMLFKQVALSNVGFYLLLVTWWSRRRLASAAAFLLGVIGALVPVCAYFAVHGAWHEFVDATIGHNLRYASRQPLAMYPQVFWLYFKPCLRSFWPILLLAAVPVVRLPWFWLSERVRHARQTTPDAPCGAAVDFPTHWPRHTILVLAWLGASFLGTAGGGFFRQHYFVQSIPPVAILAGMAVGLPRWRWCPAPLRVALRAALVVAPIAIGMLAYGWYYRPGNTEAKVRRIYGTNAVLEAVAVGRFIAARAQPQETVFILGSEPHILYYAARKSASRYIFVYPLTGPFPDVRERQRAALREIRDNQPRFIVTTSEPYSFLADPAAPTDLTDGLADLVKQSYRLAAVTPLVADGAAPLLTGARAEEVWRSAPLSCCSLAVWERVAPP